MRPDIDCDIRQFSLGLLIELEENVPISLWTCFIIFKDLVREPDAGL